jgi:hypothetical protein
MPDIVKTVRDIFSNQVFRIPDYQRGYAWEEQQCHDLLEDLELLPSSRRHFTGTLVLRPSGGEPIQDIASRPYMLMDVIDGQQRLTTLVILLKAILDEMHKLPGFERVADSLCETYLYAQDPVNQPFTKLTLNQDSQTFFADIILQLNPGILGPTIRSHERMAQAMSYFTACLAERRIAQGDAFAEWLRELYNKVTNGLTMIVYNVEDDQDAGVIFETMNDRGKSLTELEKVKNHLLYVSAKLDLPAPHDLHHCINRTWLHIYQNLMACGLAGRNYEDQLLRTHWLMAYNYDPKSWDNARSIKNRFHLKNYANRHPILLQELKDYLSSLQNTCTAYCDVYNPGRSQAFNDVSDPVQRQEVILWSRKLARLGPRASFLPLLVAVRLRNTGDGAAYQQVVLRLEKFDFRVFVWLRARANAGETTFFRFAHQIYHGAGLSWLVEELDQQILSYCPNAEFTARFERSGENWYDWGGINYFLYEYEHHLADGRPVQLNWETLHTRPKARSIEHILPQTPTDPEWLAAFDESQRQRWTNDIGNLTLTYDNSSLGNLKFSDKKGQPGETGRYVGSPLFIEHELAGYEAWGESQILERRTQIQVWALQRWKVDAEPRPSPQVRSYEDIRQYAARFDLDKALQSLHDTLGMLHSWPTVRKGLQYRNPFNYHKSLLNIYVYPGGLSVFIHMENFSNYPNMTAERAQDLLEANPGWNWYPSGQVDRLLEGLRAFQQEVFPPENGR